MRADQYQRLQTLEEALLDVFIAEADANTWPGAGKRQRELTKDERGDAYWSKRNAAATMALAVRINNYLQRKEGGIAVPTPNEDGDNEGDLQREIDDAERKAQALITRVQRKQSAA